MVGLSRHRAPPEPSGAHEHEWHVREDESALLYEDGAVYVYEDCEYVEITGSATSERLDETFYETGFECDASRYHRFDLVGIERLHGLADQHEDFAETLCEGRDYVLEAYDRDPKLVEEIEQRAAEVVCDGADGPPEAFGWIHRGHVDESAHYVTVEVFHSHGRTFEYRLTFEHTEAGVQ